MPLEWFHVERDEAISEPSEWSPAWATVVGLPVELSELSVRAGGDSLPVSMRLVGGVSRVGFRWPRRDAGRHLVRIEVGGRTSNERVSVAPRKLDAAARAVMLEQLSLGLPAEIAWSLSEAGALAGVAPTLRNTVTIAGELERVRRSVMGTSTRAGMVETVARIVRDPIESLVAEPRWTPTERVRLPMLARLPDAWRRPGNLDARGRPRALLDQRPNATRDVYENRVVCAWVELADAALRRLASLAPSAPVDALRGQIREARATLDALGDVAVLDAMPTRVSMALARRREYRAALDGFLELLRSGQARLDEDALGAPLDNIPTLYQRWATLRTLSRCLRCACEQGWKLRSQTLARIERGGVVVKVLPGGVAALVFERGDGATVRVFVERQYGAGGALRSLTYPQRPDVTVERFEPGRGHALWVLDPKYKLVADVEGASQPVKADIDKMHAYRDAIRDSLGRPVVRHAAILYLGETMRWGAEISAIGARPTASEALDADLDSLFHTVFVMPHGDPE